MRAIASALAVFAACYCAAQPYFKCATDPVTWLGASVRNVASAGEMSAFGLPGVTGVLVLDVPADSVLAKAGLRKNDVILSVNDQKTADTVALPRQVSERPVGNFLKLGISREQREMAVQLHL